MILFKPEHVPMILAGRKTQTRRIGRRRWKVGSLHQARVSYYAKPFAHLRIMAVRQERLGDITEADAIAEGYESVAEYQEVFRRIYGFWEPDRPVWVIDFEVVGKGAERRGNGVISICWKCGEKYQTTSVSTVLCPKCTPKVTVYFSDSTNIKLAGLEEPKNAHP